MAAPFRAVKIPKVRDTQTHKSSRRSRSSDVLLLATRDPSPDTCGWPAPRGRGPARGERAKRCKISPAARGRSTDPSSERSQVHKPEPVSTPPRTAARPAFVKNNIITTARPGQTNRSGRHCTRTQPRRVPTRHARLIRERVATRAGRQCLQCQPGAAQASGDRRSHDAPGPRARLALWHSARLPRPRHGARRAASHRNSHSALGTLQRGAITTRRAATWPAPRRTRRKV